VTVFTSRFGFKWNYAPHDTGWGTDYNFAHRELAALLHPVVISDTVTTPPGSPSENDTYFVPGTGATGAWSTHASKIAAFQGGAWQYYTPEVGTRMRIVSRSAFYWWNGTALTAEVTSGGGGSVLTVAGHAPDLSGDVALVVADITGAAPLSSPAFTGTPTAPTRPTNNNSTGLATTEYVDRAITALGGISSVAAGTGIGVSYSSGVYTVSVTGSYASTSYVDTAIANLVNSAPGTMDTLGEIATLLAADESTASALATTVAGKVAKAGDTMTGDLHLSVPGSSDNTDKATSTSWVRTYVTSLGFGTGSGTITNVTAGTGLSGGGSSGSVTISADTTVLATHSYVTGLGYATLASPTFTGTVTIPAGATISGFAPLASPTFTGTVTIPAGASISGFAPLASPTFHWHACCTYSHSRHKYYSACDDCVCASSGSHCRRGYKRRDQNGGGDACRG
jgi:hypothetical protein